MHALNIKCYMRSLPRSDGAGLLLHVQAERTREEKAQLTVGRSEKAGVLNNDRKTAKISVFPNPVGHKDILAFAECQIASSWRGLTFAKPSREAASRITQIRLIS